MTLEILLETLALATLAAALTLYLHGTQQYRGTAFGAALWPLSATLGIGVLLFVLEAVSLAPRMHAWVVVVLVGVSTVFSAVAAARVVRIAAGRWSV